MAQSTDQGTGQHKHKSSEEPYPHHEAPSTRGESSHSGSSRGSQSSQSSGGSQSGSSHSSGRESSTSGSSHSGSNDGELKNREYKGTHGEEHHHTKTYMEEHKGESSGGRKESESERGDKGTGSHRKAS